MLHFVEFWKFFNLILEILTSVIVLDLLVGGKYAFLMLWLSIYI